MDENVPRATPPNWPPLGEGLTKAIGLFANSFILVLSPKIDPPDLWDEGSIA